MVTANELMASFAERTGLVGGRPQRRYLWTDAFAVCNFLALGQVDRARSLVDRVHPTWAPCRSSTMTIRPGSTTAAQLPSGDATSQPRSAATWLAISARVSTLQT